MLKKLRRFIIKKTLEKKLLEELRVLNILEEHENAELIVDDETDFYVSFDLNSSMDLWKSISLKRLRKFTLLIQGKIK